jgi:aarF domain-containing kinase
MYLVELRLYQVLRTKAFLCHAELRGFEVMAADVHTLGKYVEHIKSVTRNFRVPLQNNYDPDQIAAYFDHRPHVLIFRLLEVLLLL